MCKHKKSLALIYVQNDTDFFENHVSLQALAFLSYHKFPIEATRGRRFPVEIRRQKQKTFRKILQISNLCPERDDARHRNYLFEKSLGPREHLPTSASHAILSFLSFIHSHSSFLSLYSSVILSLILSHTFAHFTITYFFIIVNISICNSYHIFYDYILVL